MFRTVKLTRIWVRNVVPTADRREAQRTVIESLSVDREKKMNIKLICILSSFSIAAVHKFYSA